MNLILLNGPPRSGKDTSFEILHALLRAKTGVVHEKFSLPIKLAFAGMMGVLPLLPGYIVERYEARKDETVPELGVSFRQWQIDFSEKLMKPQYGDDVFARLFLQRCHHWNAPNTTIVVSDCGFTVEYRTVVASKMFSRVTLLHTERHGCTFVNDSRETVWPGVRDDTALFKLYNNGTVDDLRRRIADILKIQENNDVSFQS